MTNAPIFCHKCGQALVNATLKGYNQATGQAIYNKVCPTGVCTHYGVGHEYKIVRKH